MAFGDTESWKHFGKEIQFWNGKLATDVNCEAVIVDFWKLMKSDECSLGNIKKHDLLFTVIALFGKSLPEMTLDVLFQTVVKKSTKTLILLKVLKEKSEKGIKIDNKEDVSLEDDVQSAKETHECNVSSAARNGSQMPERETMVNPTASLDSTEEKIQKEQEALGEFDDIFSDSSDSDESLDSDNEENFSLDFSKFVEMIRRRKKQPCNENSKESSLQSRIIGAAVFHRSYRVAEESICHLQLISVRRKYRKCGVGRFIMNKLKEPAAVGPYDAIVTYADPDAINFFKQNGFTDDFVLNSKYRKIEDNWMNSTPMCYISPLSSSLLPRSDKQNHEIVTINDIATVEHDLELWRTEQSKSYQSQMTCVIRMLQQLKSLKALTDHQAKVIDSLKKVNHHLREDNWRLEMNIKERSSDNEDKEECERGHKSLIEDLNKIQDESRKKLDFCHSLLADANVLSCQVKRISKATVCRTSFEEKLKNLGDPSLYTELYFCGGARDDQLEEILREGFRCQDMIDGDFGRGLYFSLNPRKATEYSKPGVVLLAVVGLGITQSTVKVNRCRNSPPDGCDSILTLGRGISGISDSSDQEYVIFDPNQATPSFLIEFEAEWFNVRKGN